MTLFENTFPLIPPRIASCPQSRKQYLVRLNHAIAKLTDAVSVLEILTPDPTQYGPAYEKAKFEHFGMVEQVRGVARELHTMGEHIDASAT